MPEGSEEQQSSRIEQGSTPKYNQESVQYQNGQLALNITGESGAQFDFNQHKWSPTRPMGEGIVSTKSGNDYYIFTDAEKGITYVVNTRETVRRGKLVAAHTEQYPGYLPAVEFGQPWDLPGFYITSDVESILLKYKKASNNYADVDRKIDGPNPFDTYKSLLSKTTR